MTLKSIDLSHTIKHTTSSHTKEGVHLDASNIRGFSLAPEIGIKHAVHLTLSPNERLFYYVNKSNTQYNCSIFDHTYTDLSHFITHLNTFATCFSSVQSKYSLKLFIVFYVLNIGTNCFTFNSTKAVFLDKYICSILPVLQLWLPVEAETAHIAV